MDTALNKYEEYYFNNLRQETALKRAYTNNSVPIPNEYSSIYLLSFMGLLRENYPFEKRQKTFVSDVEVKGTIEEENVKGKNKKAKKQSKKQEEDMMQLLPDDPTQDTSENDLVLTIRRGNDAYECNENALKNMFGELYDQLFERQKKEKENDNDNSIHVYTPDFDIDEDVVLNQNSKSGKTNKSAKEENKPILPYIESNINLPDDEIGKKSYDSFLFDDYNIQVQFPNKKRVQYKIIVYPLLMDQKDAHITDILVVAINKRDNRIRCNISSVLEEDTKKVEADFNDCKFIVSGSWKDGEFSSDVILVTDVQSTQNPTMRKEVNEVRPTKKMSTYYQRIKGSNGDYLNIFPLSLINNDSSTGLASAVAMIEDHYSRKVYLPTGTSFISTWFDGSQKNIILYWEGNDLVCELQEAHIEN